MLFKSFALAAALVGSVSAHATFQDLWVDGKDQAGACVYLPTSNSPITSVTGTDIACNTHSAATAKCSVAAGGKLGVEMHQVSTSSML
jgi:lytic cellulose monooxygenase (C1-hydroxylating)